jgi:oligopeptidase B
VRSAPEVVLLDEDEEAKAHAFYMVGGLSTSDDDSRLAYSEDTVGAEKFTLRVLDLDSGESLLKGEVQNTSGQVVWAADNKTLFYVLLDKTLRPYKVRLSLSPRNQHTCSHTVIHTLARAL